MHYRTEGGITLLSSVGGDDAQRIKERDSESTELFVVFYCAIVRVPVSGRVKVYDWKDFHSSKLTRSFYLVLLKVTLNRNYSIFSFVFF